LDTNVRVTKIDAVIFFSQHSVIPRSRALILIMLFSNDFDGVIETFIEIHKRFTRPNYFNQGFRISYILMKRFPAYYGRTGLISYHFAKSVYIRFIIKIENSRYCMLEIVQAQG
jgi:hypothetical protein